MSRRLAAFLAPRSIALVGVPGDLARPGARPLVYLLKHGYRGRIFPVNPRRTEIGGLRAYPALAELPERPDTVWVGVPGPEVLGVLQEAGRLGIPNAVILTAGFGETDAGGRRREQALRAAAERDGITVLGPNMLGFINFWERIPLTFSAAGGLDRLLAGGLGVVSQSGALAGAVVNRADDRAIGMSAMISTGNEAGITLAECLDYFADDPRTQVVAMIAEGIRDGARFRRAAARLLEAGKPLVALKVGRSEAGRRNALTHTGALAGSHAAWRAVARQLGIIEVETFEDMVEIAGFHARERRPVAGRVGVLTTSGGASIMTADQLEARGLRMPRLSASTVAGLGALLPEHARTRDNPVDVTAGMPEATFEKVLATVVADPGLDVLITAVTGAAGVERAHTVVRVARATDTPVVACWLGGSQTEDGVRVLDAEGVPAFRNPRTAAAAIASARDLAATRAAWRARRPLTAPPAAGGDSSYAAVSALARRSGVPLAAEALASTPAAAARAARRLGLPVAVKVVAADLPHKSDAGALALNVASAPAVSRIAARLLRAARGAAVEGVLVQRMARPGVEVLVGVTRDATFGMMLVVGAGGVQTELWADTTSRPLPVTRAEIVAMLSEVRSLRALHGFRGAPAADTPALVRAVAGVARLALALGERLRSLEANPVIVHAAGKGAVAVDLLVSLAPDRAASGGSLRGDVRQQLPRTAPGVARR
ncbi:MAG TPA: acetate--CoA ligase family protein [Candidatus Limnocylindria bacterium]|nr:acetate--CoA ligase family protein [Candidatus Limnocylindria bacterium]